MTREDEIASRCEAATPGEWCVRARPGWGAFDVAVKGSTGICMPQVLRKDAEFIANAKQDIPYLLERLKAAEARAEKMRALLKRYRDETPLGHQPHMIAHEVDAALVADTDAGEGK